MRFLLILMLGVVIHGAAAAQRLAAGAYTLVIAPYADTIATPQPEFVFITNGIAYRSLDALKARIIQFPKGTTLTWAPSDLRGPGQPPLSTQAEREAFASYCEEHGVRFIIVPAG